MSLSYPSRIGDQVPASSEARDNLSKLLRVDPRGGKDQVATRVALQYFQRAMDLSPGYLDGLKSWSKANCYYVLAGTAATAAIGLTAYAASTTTYGRWIAGGLLGTTVVSYALGFRPEENIKALLTLAIRDTAVRAADSSVKNDERIWQAKEKKAKACHKEILNQLSAVYNDCAKELKKLVATSSKNANERLALKHIADRLDERLPTIEKLLSGLHLGKHEVEGILQRFKDAIRFVQDQAGRLYPGKPYEEMNADLLAGWSIDSVREIAVPLSIRDRASAAKNSRMGILEEAAGYGSAVLSGIGTLAATTTAAVIVAGAVHAYQNGFAATTSKAQELWTKLANQNYRGLIEGIDKNSLIGMGALGVCAIGSFAYVTAKNGLDHYRKVEDNTEFVASELAACTEDLRTIYDGVASHLQSLPSTPRASLTDALEARIPAIREEMAGLRLVPDPSDILRNLEETLSF